MLRPIVKLNKVLNGLYHINWRNNPEKVVQGDENGPAAFNLRRGGICFRRDPDRRKFLLIIYKNIYRYRFQLKLYILEMFTVFP